MLTLLQPTGGVVVVLDKKPDEPRETIELRATTEIRQAAISDAMQYFADRIQAQGANAAFETPQRGGAASDATGAALAAGVLTAVDEDEEGAEDAPVPDEFGYETDNMEE
jgi:26S proteasome regulatory subunit N2